LAGPRGALRAHAGLPPCWAPRHSATSPSSRSPSRSGWAPKSSTPRVPHVDRGLGLLAPGRRPTDARPGQRGRPGRARAVPHAGWPAAGIPGVAGHAAIVNQFSHPRGTARRVAGWVMAHRPSNRQRNRRVVSLLEVQPTDRVLEMGFGPGLAIAELRRRVGDAGHMYGIDHSDVMLRQATRRNTAAIAAGRVGLVRASKDCGRSSPRWVLGCGEDRRVAIDDYVASDRVRSGSRRVLKWLAGRRPIPGFGDGRHPVGWSSKTRRPLAASTGSWRSTPSTMRMNQTPSGMPRA
jgi:hypothetical protein